MNNKDDFDVLIEKALNRLQSSLGDLIKIQTCAHDFVQYTEDYLDDEKIYCLTCIECKKILSIQENEPGTFEIFPNDHLKIGEISLK